MSAPAQVLMTADAVGGVWTYALDLAQGLTEIGFHVTLAVMGPEPSAVQRQAARTVRGLRLLETGLPLDWMASDLGAVLESGCAIADLARASGADLVHLNAPALAASNAFDLPVVGMAHSCLASWWEAVKAGPAPPDFAWRTQLLAAGYRACARVIAPTRAFAATTARLYPGTRPLVVANGRRTATTPRRFQRTSGVITAGRLWDEGKNLDTLDRAAARLSAPVFAAGPLHGPQGQRAQMQHVRALGPLAPDALASLLARTPVFAALPLYEPFGLAVLEAAQAGCALVLSDIPSLRELWDGAALFVDPRAPDEAAAAIEGLLADDEHLAEMAAAAVRRAERYSAQALTAGTLAVYAAVMAAQRQEARA